MITKKQLLYTKQCGSGIGSFFKNTANVQLFRMSIKNIKDGDRSIYSIMINPRLELFKNRVFEYGKDWIDYNQIELNDVKSLKDIVSLLLMIVQPNMNIQKLENSIKSIKL